MGGRSGGVTRRTKSVPRGRGQRGIPWWSPALGRAGEGRGGEKGGGDIWETGKGGGGVTNRGCVTEEREEGTARSGLVG